MWPFFQVTCMIAFCTLITSLVAARVTDSPSWTFVGKISFVAFVVFWLGGVVSAPQQRPSR